MGLWLTVLVNVNVCFRKILNMWPVSNKLGSALIGVGLKAMGSHRVRRDWHCLQDEMILSISLSNPGQYTIKRALCLVRTTPGVTHEGAIAPPDALLLE